MVGEHGGAHRVRRPCPTTISGGILEGVLEPGMAFSTWWDRRTERVSDGFMDGVDRSSSTFVNDLTGPQRTGPIATTRL